jgi:hypothetical protein
VNAQFSDNYSDAWIHLLFRWAEIPRRHPEIYHKKPTSIMNVGLPDHQGDEFLMIPRELIGFGHFYPTRRSGRPVSSHP